MNKEAVKRAFNEAEKELKEEQEAVIKEQVKDIVRKTLERIDELKEQKQEIDKEMKILKMDIDDLKEGKLDRIQERQEKDPKAKQVSVVVIHKQKVQNPVSYWYQPYTFEWNQPGFGTKFYCDSGSTATYNTSPCFTINNSIAKDSVVGTYKVKKKIIHLR